MPHGGFGGPDHRLRAGMVLTVDPSSPSSVVRRAVCSLVMELLCSLPSGDKEEERHKRGAEYVYMKVPSEVRMTEFY